MDERTGLYELLMSRAFLSPDKPENYFRVSAISPTGVLLDEYKIGSSRTSGSTFLSLQDFF
ncbi:MAG: hypothetical protein AABX11_06215 [Nanoarchaeota archaeon]